MLQQLTSSQLTELEAMWAFEGGWGSYKEDWRTAQTNAIQINVNRGKDAKPVRPVDLVMNPDMQWQEQERLANKEVKVDRVRDGLKKLAETNPANKGRGKV